MRSLWCAKWAEKVFIDNILFWWRFLGPVCHLLNFILKVAYCIVLAINFFSKFQQPVLLVYHNCWFFTVPLKHDDIKERSNPVSFLSKSSLLYIFCRSVLIFIKLNTMPHLNYSGVLSVYRYKTSISETIEMKPAKKRSWYRCKWFLRSGISSSPKSLIHLLDSNWHHKREKTIKRWNGGLPRSMKSPADIILFTFCASVRIV